MSLLDLPLNYLSDREGIRDELIGMHDYCTMIRGLAIKCRGETHCSLHSVTAALHPRGVQRKD